MTHTLSREREDMGEPWHRRGSVPQLRRQQRNRYRPPWIDANVPCLVSCVCVSEWHGSPALTFTPRQGLHTHPTFPHTNIHLTPIHMLAPGAPNWLPTLNPKPWTARPTACAETPTLKGAVINAVFLHELPHRCWDGALSLAGARHISAPHFSLASREFAPRHVQHERSRGER